MHNPATVIITAVLIGGLIWLLRSRSNKTTSKEEPSIVIRDKRPAIVVCEHTTLIGVMLQEDFIEALEDMWTDARQRTTDHNDLCLENTRGYYVSAACGSKAFFFRKETEGYLYEHLARKCFVTRATFLVSSATQQPAREALKSILGMSAAEAHKLIHG